MTSHERVGRGASTAATAAPAEDPERAAKRRSATRGAFFAEFVDMFDIYLPTVVLTPALIYFQPARLDPGTTAIFTSLVFATTLVGRPIGAAVFGALADRLGRRRSTIISVTGFGVITLLIALVPGFTTIGIASYWLLIVLRFLDGICLGGGYTGALPLAMEYSTKGRRGLLGGIILAAFPAAYVVITLLGLACFALFPLAGPGSAYAVWGWRVPFVLGAVLAFVLAGYYVRSVSESEIWQAAEAAKAEGTSQGGAARPLLAVLRSPTFLQVFAMMTGFWLTQNLVTLFLPTTVLRNLVGLSNNQLTVTLLIGYICLVGSYIGSGVLAQRIGRKRFFVIGGLLIATVGVALMAVLVNARGLSLGLVIVVVCVFSIIVTAPWGVVLPYITERFRTDVRASGFGLGFSVSVVIPSFYAFFLEGLGSLMPYAVAVLVLLGLGGLLGAAGAAVGPETRDVDFDDTAPTV